MSSKRGRAAANKAKTETSGLIDALKFVALAQADKQGEPYQTHCAIWNGHVIASDGVLAIGAKIQAEISACPHTRKLIDALSKCDAQLSITQTDEYKLQVRSGKYTANVPCVPWAMMPPVQPNQSTHKIDNAAKLAIVNAGALTDEDAQRVMYAATLFQNGTAVGTNGKMLLEQFHGFEIGTSVLLPRRAIDALSKSNKTLAGFGSSENSATFWNDDGSFIRTQLYAEQYSGYAHIFTDAPANPAALPAGFYDAVRKVESYSDSGFLFFREARICSHEQDELGALFEIEGLPEGMKFSAHMLKQIEPFTELVSFDKAHARLFFYANNIRGALMGAR